MNEQPIVNLQFTPPGADLMIAALRKLPHEQVDGLVQQIFAQYQAEVKRLQADAEAAQRQLEAEVSDVEPKAE